MRCNEIEKKPLAEGYTLIHPLYRVKNMTSQNIPYYSSLVNEIDWNANFSKK